MNRRWSEGAIEASERVPRTDVTRGHESSRTWRAYLTEARVTEEQHLVLSIPLFFFFVLDIGADPVSSSIDVLPRYTTIHPHQALNQTMTRTHKVSDRDHVGLANSTAAPEEHLPRYFGKAGISGNDPAQTKKQGSGKGNWGKAGSEVEDHDYHLTNPRRRTNSFSAAASRSVLKTKFEATDPEVIEYEEDVHGPGQADLADQNELEKMTPSSSADTTGSVEEEEGAHAAVAGAEEHK
ncbi:hypothetical protein LTR01_001741 [Friedmanniomyces endolithicus]|nr:hypothetical protein LTR01_001741 [Friedmanniomyces endolithicus]